MRLNNKHESLRTKNARTKRAEHIMRTAYRDSSEARKWACDDSDVLLYPRRWMGMVARPRFTSRSSASGADHSNAASATLRRGSAQSAAHATALRMV
jgi:hypothetical protein